MAEASAGSPSARQRHSWRRPPAWPDGRLLHPREDLTTRVTIGALVPLVAIWVWALGRVDYFEASVGDWWWILGAGLIAASVVSLLVAKRRYGAWLPARIWQRYSRSTPCGALRGGPTAA